MSMRFRKSISLGKGSRINLNKKGFSVTNGFKGYHVTTNSNGKVTRTIGIPGTGISFRLPGSGSNHSLLKLFLIICLAALILLYAWIPVVIAGIAYGIYCYVKKAPLNKKYVVIGILIFAVSIGAFIFTNVSNGRSPFSFGGNQIQSSAVQK